MEKLKTILFGFSAFFKRKKIEKVVLNDEETYIKEVLNKLSCCTSRKLVKKIIEPMFDKDNSEYISFLKSVDLAKLLELGLLKLVKGINDYEDNMSFPEPLFYYLSGESTEGRKLIFINYLYSFKIEISLKKISYKVNKTLAFFHLIKEKTLEKLKNSSLSETEVEESMARLEILINNIKNGDGDEACKLLDVFLYPLNIDAHVICKGVFIPLEIEDIIEEKV